MKYSILALIAAAAAVDIESEKGGYYFYYHSPDELNPEKPFQLSSHLNGMVMYIDDSGRDPSVLKYDMTEQGPRIRISGPVKTRKPTGGPEEWWRWDEHSKTIRSDANNNIVLRLENNSEHSQVVAKQFSGDNADYIHWDRWGHYLCGD